MSNSINPLAMMATTGMTGTQSRSGKGSSWYEVMADAWGKTLDAKASEIEAAGDALADGRAEIAFAQPQWAVTPGQSVVIYESKVCLGGGIIA